MARIHAVALGMFLLGILVFCVAPGEFGGGGWRYVHVEGAEEEQLIKVEAMADGWIALGCGLVFGAFILLLLSSSDDVPRKSGPTPPPERNGELTP